MTRFFVAAVVTVVLAVGLAGPVSAHDGGTRYYLALGDSIATGRQAIPVVPNQGYVAQLHRTLSARDPALRLENLACDGETTTSMRRGGRCAYPAGNQVAAAVNFLRAHRGQVRLITITVGGNDIAPCGLTGTIDRECVTTALATIATNLLRTMAELRAVAPKVTIVGMTLYDAFLASWLTGPAGQDFARQSIPVTQAVNRVIAGSYRAVGARIADVETTFSTTDLTTMVTLPGLGTVPLAVARICQWTSMCLPPPIGPDFHPNTTGYTVITNTFRSQV